MDNTLNNFKQFARTRKNMAESKRIPFKNIAKVIQGFVKILLEPSVTKKKNLIEKWMLFLKNDENKVFSKNWLLDIVEKLRE